MPEWFDMPISGHTYLIRHPDDVTWHITDDGAPIGTLKRDERGYFKPGSDARHDDFEAALRLTVRGIIR